MAQTPRNRQRNVAAPAPRVVFAPIFPPALTAAVCAGLVVLIAAVYAQVCWHDFIICDDDVYVYDNPVVKQGITWPGVCWAFSAPHQGNWHPLTWMSHMADWRMFGDWAGGHHLVSVAIHAISAVLLFLVLVWMTGRFWPSAMVAALFALHPLRVESVAWAAERKDVLSGMFWMLTMLAYCWYAQRTYAPKWLMKLMPNAPEGFVRGLWVFFKYMLVLAALTLGLMSKSMLVTLPCVLVLMDIWPLRRWRLPGMPEPAPGQSSPRFPRQKLDVLLVEKIPMFAIVIGISLLTVAGQGAAGALNGWEALSLMHRVCNALISYMAYLGQMVWPMHLTIFYPHPGMIHTDRIYHTLYLPARGAAAVLLVISMAVVWFGRRRLYLPIGWFWYLGTLIPVIGLMQVGIQAKADRYTYLPSIGICWLVVWGACDLASRWKYGPWALRIAAPLVLLSFALLTVRQVSYWKDSETLFAQSIEAVPDNYFGNNHLGKEYDRQGMHKAAQARLAAAGGDQEEAAKLREESVCLWGKAAEQFEASIRINPHYDFGNNNLGVVYARFADKALSENHPEEAKRLTAQALHLFSEAVAINPKYADAHNNLCVLFGQEKRFAEAAFHGEVATKIRADYHASDYVNLGHAYEGMKRWDDSARHNRNAIQADPAFAEAYFSLGSLSACSQPPNLELAGQCFGAVVKLDSNNVEGRCNFGVICTKLGDLAETQGHTEEAQKYRKEAISQFEEALRLNPQNAKAQQLLKQVRAGLGGG